MSIQVNLIEIQLEYIERRRTRLFIGRIGENRPIDAFNPHQRPRLNASIRNGKNKSWPSDLLWTLLIDPMICV